MVKRCCCRRSRGWWSGVDRPRKAFDNGVVWVNNPAASFCVANGAVFFAAIGEFGALAPRK